MTGVLFVFGNFVLKILPALHGLRPYLRALAKGQALMSSISLAMTVGTQPAG